MPAGVVVRNRNIAHAGKKIYIKERDTVESCPGMLSVGVDEVCLENVFVMVLFKENLLIIRWRETVQTQ